MELSESAHDPDVFATGMRYLSQQNAAILLFLFSVFCWYCWTFRAYRQFKSHHLDISFLFNILKAKLLGKTFGTREAFGELIKQARRFQQEGASVVWLFRPYLFVYGEEFSKTLFYEEAVAEKSSGYSLVTEYFGNGLLTSKKEIWKVHRKLLNPVFRLGVIKGKFHIFNSNSIELVEKLGELEGKPTEDLLKILKCHTFSLMSESILGFKLNDERYASKIGAFIDGIDKGVELFMKRLTRPWLYWKFLLPFFDIGREFLEGVDKLSNFTAEVTAEMRKSVAMPEADEDEECDKETRKSFAHIVLEQNVKDPTFTMEYVNDHVKTLMAAGYDTVSHALLFSLYLLGRHPDVQEKAFQEAKTVCGEEVTYEDACKLKYIECVFKESLRLYPIGPMISRKLVKDIQCGKYTLPKGAEIIIFTFILHRNPEVFKDPEKFIPERFLGNVEIRPWMFLPFAEGYRSCIGKQYALMAAKVTLAHVLRRFKITSLREIEEKDLDWTFILKPAKDIPMIFVDRRED